MKLKELRVSVLKILESENEYIGVSELVKRLAKVDITVVFNFNFNLLAYSVVA